VLLSIENRTQESCVCERERERERGSKEEHAVVLATFEAQNRT